MHYTKHTTTMKKMPLFFATLFCLTASVAFIPSASQAQSLYASGMFDTDGATCRFAGGSEAEAFFPYWQTCVDEAGKVYKLTVANGGIDELFVDGEKIPAAQIRDFQSFVGPCVMSLTEKSDLQRREGELSAQLSSLDKYQRQVEDRIKELETGITQLDLALSAAQSANFDTRESLSRKRTKLVHEKAMLSDENEDLIEKRTILLRHRSELSRKSERLTTKDNEQRAQILEAIIADLKKEGLVSNARGLSYKLSNVELVVNGKRADAAMHRKFVQKYIPVVPSGETGFMYRWRIRPSK